MATCALVAASDFNAEYFGKLDAQGTFDEVYAVDGGFAHLEAIGRAPDLAIGDFDSLGYVPNAKRVSRYPVKKDKSDFELALQRARDYGFTDVVAFGVLGGRLDHTLSSLQLLARYAEEGMNVTAIGDTYAVRALAGPDAFELPVCESGTVSVFSVSDEARGVIERGMEYPLDDAVLTNRTSLGLSNELTGEPAAVAVESGTLLVFYPLS